MEQVGTNQKLEKVAKHSRVIENFTGNRCQKRQASRTTRASDIEAIIGGVWVDSGRKFESVEGVVQGLCGSFEATEAGKAPSLRKSQLN